jgi:hypothetical protein
MVGEGKGKCKRHELNLISLIAGGGSPGRCPVIERCDIEAATGASATGY